MVYKSQSSGMAVVSPRLFWRSLTRLELIRVRNRLSSSFRLDLPVLGPTRRFSRFGGPIAGWLISWNIPYRKWMRTGGSPIFKQRNASYARNSLQSYNPGYSWIVWRRYLSWPHDTWNWKGEIPTTILPRSLFFLKSFIPKIQCQH